MTRTEASGTQSTGSPAGLTVAGIVAGLGPLWLFAIAAFAGPGPWTSSLIFAVPVLASTTVAIWAALRLARRGHRAAAWTVAIVALVAGVIGYAAWVYLASLGIRFGDGPL
ncbi:hypothetical protein [Agromyces sp. SYSU T00266]|uniref:hypothetical protein n=1 Tax=Agromyces zhanjiangensis TaxID=3158562 RepID=UPI003393BF5E